MEDSVKNNIFHTQDLCLCTLDTNLICKKCVEVRINMTHKRNKFLTFCFSCMPGAGQMFLGFFKQGVSLMTVFLGIFIVSHWLYLSVLSLGAIIVWFYAFFDAMNKNSMPDEEFAMLEDAYIWGDNLDCLSKLPKGKGRKILAIVLICFGIYMLCNSVVSALAGMGIYISYEINQFLLHYIPQFIVAFVIIAVGLRMIAGKKQEIEFDENEKYFEGRDDK